MEPTLPCGVADDCIRFGVALEPFAENGTDAHDGVIVCRHSLGANKMADALIFKA